MMRGLVGFFGGLGSLYKHRRINMGKKLSVLLLCLAACSDTSYLLAPPKRTNSLLVAMASSCNLLVLGICGAFYQSLL